MAESSRAAHIGEDVNNLELHCVRYGNSSTQFKHLDFLSRYGVIYGLPRYITVLAHLTVVLADIRYCSYTLLSGVSKVTHAAYRDAVYEEEKTTYTTTKHAPGGSIPFCQRPHTTQKISLTRIVNGCTTHIYTSSIIINKTGFVS